MISHRARLLSLLVMSCLVLSSCVTGEVNLDTAAQAISDAIPKIEKQSDAWRDELPVLLGQLAFLEGQVSADEKAAVTDAKNQVSALLEQSKNIASILTADAIARAGVEFRCNADFVQAAVSDQLQYLVDRLKFWDKPQQPQKPAHKTCQVIPDTIRLYQSGGAYQIDFSNMKEKNIVQLYGYDFTPEYPPSLDLYDADNQIIQHLQVKVDYITQYQINLNFDRTNWDGVQPASSVIFSWPDKPEEPRPWSMSLTLMAPARLKLTNLIADPPLPIAVLGSSRKDQVRFKATVTNEGDMPSGSTAVTLLSGIDNSRPSSVTLDSIQPGVSKEIEFPDGYVYPAKGRYTPSASLSNGDSTLQTNLMVYIGFYCEVYSPYVRGMWSIISGPMPYPAPCRPLQAGDVVEVFDAGGCVNAGGDGLTSKHYVTPLDENGNPDTLHFGMVAIPGTIEKADMVSVARFNEVIRSKSLQGTPALWLGYSDDSFGDNNYSFLDSGYKDQCLNQPPAYVIFRVTRYRTLVP